MRVVLVVPKANYPHDHFDMPIMAQGPAYIASALKEAGHEVFGVNMHLYGDLPARDTLKKLITGALDRYQPHVVAVGGLTADYLFIRDTIRFTREHDASIPIICGGGLISSDAEFATGLVQPDFAIIGEAEESIVEILRELEGDGHYEDIQGIVYHHNGRQIKTPSRKVMRDLDDLPYPDYDVLDIETYFALSSHLGDFTVQSRMKPRLLSVSAGRSCPFRCTFCYHSTGAIYRRRDISRVVEEIGAQHERYHFNILHLYDELFTIKPQRVYDFCEQLKALKLDLDWTCSMRVGDINLDLMKAMKDAGCSYIGFGFESASDVVLKSMVKKITQAEIKRALELGEQVGMGIQANFIFGDVAETPKTIRETTDFFYNYCSDHIVHTGYIQPFPDTPLFREVEKRGLIPDRKYYYETLHYKPIWNMTTMPNKVFHDLIRPVINDRLYGAKACTSFTFTPEKLENLARLRTFRPNIHAWRADLICPHCDRENSYVFQFGNDVDTAQGQLAALEPIVQFCTSCHRRFLIPALQLAGMEQSFTAFKERCDRLRDEQTPLLAGPYIHPTFLKTLKFYGVDIAELNISAFYDFSCQVEGTFLEGYPLFPMNFDTIRRFGSCAFLLLPASDNARYLQTLAEFGFSPDRIIHCPLNTGLAVERLTTRLNGIRQRVGDEPVVIYGAGEHTHGLFEIPALRRLNIVALADRDFNKWGSSMEGLPVIPPTEIPDRARHVVISTKAHERAVKKDLTQTYGDRLILHGLYHEQDALIGAS